MNWENILKQDSPLTDVNAIKRAFDRMFADEKEITGGGFSEDNYSTGEITDVEVKVDEYNAKVDTLERRVFESSGDITFTYKRTKDGESGSSGETVKGTFKVTGKIDPPLEGQTLYSTDKQLIRITKIDVEADIEDESSRRIKEEVVYMLRIAYKNIINIVLEADIDWKARSDNDFTRPLYGQKEEYKSPRQRRLDRNKSKGERWKDVMRSSKDDPIDKEYMRLTSESGLDDNFIGLGLTKKLAEKIGKPHPEAGYELYGEFTFNGGIIDYNIEEYSPNTELAEGGLEMTLPEGGTFIQNLVASYSHPNKQLNKEERTEWVEGFRKFKKLSKTELRLMIINNEGK